MNPTVLKLEELKRVKNAKFSGCLSVASHMPFTHVELHPLGNLVSLGSCTQEVISGSDTVKPLEHAFPFVEESFRVFLIFRLLFGLSL